LHLEASFALKLRRYFRAYFGADTGSFLYSTKADVEAAKVGAATPVYISMRHKQDLLDELNRGGFNVLVIVPTRPPG
jgi:hypothetical protein